MLTISDSTHPKVYFGAYAEYLSRPRAQVLQRTKDSASSDPQGQRGEDNMNLFEFHFPCRGRRYTPTTSAVFHQTFHANGSCISCLR